MRFSYWRGINHHEVGVVAEIGDQIIPFEVKHHSQHINAKALKGLLRLCKRRSVVHGNVVTKSLDDFGSMRTLPEITTNVMLISAPLLCYWMEESVLKQTFGV